MRLLIFLLLFAGCQSHPPALERTNNQIADCCTATGKSFAVASAGERASQSALEIHKKGCNVVDAAIAATFVLAVERPQGTGIGGGGFLTLYLKRKKKGPLRAFVDFRETAPRTARANMFLKDGKTIDNLSRDGVHAAGTPGFVAGLFDTYEKYGSRAKDCKWPQLLQPAVDLALNGFPVYLSLADKIEVRKEVLAKDPEAARLFLPHGSPLKVGDALIQKDLGNTLRLIARSGKQDFYRGITARRMADFIKASAIRGIPHVDETDLRNYKPVFKTPLEGSFRGFTILTAPPSSAGGVTLLESLNILSGFKLPDGFSQPTHRSAYLHLLSETLLRAFADRTGIGDKQDPAVYQRLLGAQYAAFAGKVLNLEHATAATMVKAAESVSVEKPHTAHTSVMDANGDAVSVTTTVNYYFGAGVMVPDTGVFLNDEMDDFATQRGATNLSGLPASTANSIAPGKRPVSSMVPTIVMKGEQPVLVVGAAGSSTIITGVLQTILNYLVISPYDLRTAVFEGRMHKQYEPGNDTLALETGAFTEETQRLLKEKGHTLAPARFSAQVQAVGWDSGTGILTAVREPRDYGGAEAY